MPKSHESIQFAKTGAEKPENASRDEVSFEFCQILLFAVIGGVILSWVSAGNPHPLLQLIEEISDKILSPIRNFIPSMGGLDFSPLLVLIILNQIDVLLGSIVRSLL